MPLTTEHSQRYGNSATDRRVGSYSSAQAGNRRWSDRARQDPPEDKVEQRARGLGWFSIGLGLAQIGMPRALARFIGLSDNDETRNTLFAIGLREITSGIGILSRDRAEGWVWSRVGGDLMDLALLGRALNSEENNTGRVAATTAAVVGVTVVDFITGRQLGGEPNGHRQGGRVPGEGIDASRGVQVTQSITINRPRAEVYGFWHNFENLPRFMEHLESVLVLDERRSHWKAKAPVGTSVEWDAETIEDRPDEVISWRSLAESDVPNSGVVRFKDAPGNRGTEVIVELIYQPPGGKLAALIAKLFGEEPGQQVKSDLRRLKQVLELGEVVRSDASIHRGTHPAQPPKALSDADFPGRAQSGTGDRPRQPGAATLGSR